MIDRPPLLLDACVLINLVASRHATPILRAIPWQPTIVSAVHREVHRIRRGGTGEDADEREPVDLTPFVEAGLLAVADATEDEPELFVALTQEFGDGEAMTMAVALIRGWALATDERKARRRIGDRLIRSSTLDLVKVWTKADAVPPPVIRQVLADIRQRGSYLPHRTHPLKEWWDRNLAGS